jgi:RNA polymerase sigma factor (sigma-70 family)
LTADPAAASDAYASVDARLTLRNAMQALPRLQRAVLVATYLRDHNDEQIAEMIGRTPATVRSLRHRGLKTLRATLGTAEAPPAVVAPLAS